MPATKGLNKKKKSAEKSEQQTRKKTSGKKEQCTEDYVSILIIQLLDVPVQ
jgi:hypothetical protein